MTTKREPVFLTVDVAVVIRGMFVVLITRKDDLVEGKFMLPGGYVEIGESGLAAAVRELKEEIGLELEIDDLQFMCVLDWPERDPRPGRRVSHVYRADLDYMPNLVASDGAKEVYCPSIAWLKPEDMGLDHWSVIAQLRPGMRWRTPQEVRAIVVEALKRLAPKFRKKTVRLAR